jgi:hypothetical protein
MKVRASELVIATGAAIAAVALVYAMMLAERTGLDHALSIAAPLAVQPGADVPVRAYVMHGVSVEDVPALVEAEVAVWITEGARELPHRTTLTASPSTTTAEGFLPAPSAPGTYSMHAEARSASGARLATVTRDLSVATDAPGAAELGRLAAPLSQFALGPLVIEPSEQPPPAFAVRIESGVCIPDRPCALLVDLGTDELELRVEPGPAVTRAGAMEREGRFVRALVQVTGSEGELTVAALRQGRVIARRSVRLPVGLATPSMTLASPFVRDGHATLTVAPPPGRGTLVLDVAREGHFVRTLTLAVAEADETGRGEVDVDLGFLPPGVARLQLRADPFPTDRSVSRLVRVEGAPHVEGPLGAEGPIAFAFHAAEAEASELELPGLVSGLAQDRARVEGSRSIVRVVAIAGMLIAGVLLVMAILRRSIAAEADAELLLREAGVKADDRSITTQRRTLVLGVLALALAILTGIALIAAKDALGG